MSKKAATVGDIGTDHDGFHPTPIISGSTDIIIDNKPAARVGDPLAPHSKPGSPPHPRSIATGSSTVFFNGKPAALTGSGIDCGGGVIIGGSSVIIGDQAPAARSAPSPAAEQAEALAEGTKGAFWPPYNPITGEDLTAKLRDVLEANHKKAIILTLEDAMATLQDMWQEKGTDALKTASSTKDLGDYGMTIYKSYELVKQFGDMGVRAEVFKSNGKEYIAITTKNNSGKVLRHVLVNEVRLKLNGHKYRINNPKISQLGLSPQSRATSFKGGAAVTFVISAGINTNELIFNDQFHLVDWFGNVGADMFKALVQFGAGEAVLLLAFAAGAPILIGTLLVIATYVIIDIAFEEWEVSEKVVGALNSATTE
ncbi:type VI secretion system PAAR protein [Aeromonas salmonicida]|uniref:type VI secretion system PAAR protein n=1 Tax=Aeromonas salmonicida TaxID=645 RepID=UPI003D1AAF1A